MRVRQGLRVGVGTNEFKRMLAGGRHVADGVAAGAADADDFDDRRRLGNLRFGQGRLRFENCDRPAWMFHNDRWWLMPSLLAYPLSRARESL
jgi:hypothetical protein